MLRVGVFAATLAGFLVSAEGKVTESLISTAFFLSMLTTCMS